PLGAALFFIAAARPELRERGSGWGGGRRNASLLGVQPLSSEETASLADVLLAARFSEEVREAIVERAEGNPFFVEELVAALAERGDFQLPDSVQALLAARIDLLPPVEKGSLQAAAVIGRIFWTGPVRELLGGEEPDWALLE